MVAPNNIEALREAKGWKRPKLATLMGTTPQQVERLEKGRRRLTQDWMTRAAKALGVKTTDIIAEELVEVDDSPDHDDDIDMVGIQHIDQAYGMGATFADSPVAVDVLLFPKIWIDSITHSPPALLTWTRGRGDSMEPTIRDGDLVLLDRSQRKVEEQDAMWAYTVGDMAAIKRLRVKGDRFLIFSDNPSVPDDEEPIDFVNIVGRVIFVGMRK